MAKETPDPSAIFLDWVTQWERSFDTVANQVMGTESFSQAMNEFQKAQLNAQKMLAENMTQILTNMNMPSREDILRLNEAIQGLDRRLERIEAQLSGSAASTGSEVRKPPRTRQPPVEADQQRGKDK